MFSPHLYSAIRRGPLLLYCCPTALSDSRTFSTSKTSYKDTHYDVLGVTDKASQDEIKAAYLEKAKKYHPDLASEESASHDQFVKVQAAYENVGSPIKRREYDEFLKFGNTAWYQHAHGPWNQEREDRSFSRYAKPPRPPNWGDKYAFGDPGDENKTFWQRHWLGVIGFVVIQFYMIHFYMAMAGSSNDRLAIRMAYRLMTEDQWKTYYRETNYKWKKIKDMFDPEKQEERRNEDQLIMKLHNNPFPQRRMGQIPLIEKVKPAES